MVVDTSLDLTRTLDLIAETITSSLGFGVAVMNLVTGDELVVVAVSGPPEVRQVLMGLRQARDDWQRLLSVGQAWGSLRFLDHSTAGEMEQEPFLMWVPDLQVSDDPEAWHPDDALFAPLTGVDGQVVGVLSVDLPSSGLRPSPAQCRALEAFGVTAALAVQHAVLSSEHAVLAQEARVEHVRFQSIFDASPIAVALLDKDNRLCSVNPAYCRFLGRIENDLLGVDPHEFTYPEDVDLSRAAVRALRLAVDDAPCLEQIVNVRGTARRGSDEPGASGGGAVAEPAPSGPLAPVEKRYVRPDGSLVWGRLHLAMLNPLSEPGIVVAQIEDITARKLAERRLRQQAERDALTGLPNRAETLRRLRQALEQDAMSGRMTAVFFCDLDEFKQINDTLGHTAGDEYLQAIAARLVSCLRPEDTAGRLGGDEFLIVVPALPTPTDAIGLAGRLLEAVGRPWLHGDEVLRPSVSIGIAYTNGSATADELVSQADNAMYVAKTRDRGSWYVHDPAVPGTTLALGTLRADLPAALAEQQFVLHYQPIVRLHDRTVLAHEALLRWQHPRLGLLPPAAFLDVVLDSEYEAPLTDWLIRQACRMAAGPTEATATHTDTDTDELNTTGVHGNDVPTGGVRATGIGCVTVNVSSNQIGRRDLPDVIATALSATGLPADQLVLELTEDRLLSRPDGGQRLQVLRDLGVGLALDDFGSGYAGLKYLQRFTSLTTLKLDRGFTAELGRNLISPQIITSTVALARGCGLRLVVEGVETEQQASALQELGVTYAQGFLFGHPTEHPSS